MARLNTLLGGNSPQSNSNSKKGFGNKSKLASREQQFGKGIGAFDKFVESLTVDGKRDDRDRAQIKSTLDRFLRDGLITSAGAKKLSERYMLDVKRIPGKGGRSLASFGKKRK
jgi:hypothetical protein